MSNISRAMHRQQLEQMRPLRTCLHIRDVYRASFYCWSKVWHERVCLIMQDNWHYAVVSWGSGQPARDLHYKRFDGPSGSCRLFQQDGRIPIGRPSISAVRLCDGGSDSQHSPAASSHRLAQVSSRLLGSSGNTRSAVGCCLHLITVVPTMLPSVPAGGCCCAPMWRCHVCELKADGVLSGAQMTTIN